MPGQPNSETESPPALRGGRRRAALPAAAAALLALACCGDVSEAERKAVESDDARASRSLAEVGGRADAHRAGAKSHDRSFVAVKPVRIRAGAAFPEAFLGEEAVSLASSVPIDLAGILAELSRATGVPHAVAIGPEGRVVVPGSRDGSDGGGAGMPSARTALDSAGIGAAVRVRLKGPLPSVLDAVASEFGLAWDYDGRRVMFRQFVHRRYMIASLPPSSEGGGSAAGIDGEIEAALRMAAGAGSDVAYARGTGAVDVTATPEAQRRVAALVGSLNGELGIRVAFDVTVLTVNLSQSRGRGIDIRGIVGEGTDRTVSWTGNHAVPGAPSAVSIGVVAGDADLEAVVSALDRQGGVSVETRAGATTANNVAAPMEVVHETAYARRVETVPDAQGGASTTIEPGTLTTGFEMSLLPRVLNSREILLRFKVKLSDLNEIAEFTSDRQTIQLPKVSTTSFEQSALLGDGQILVLAGFERGRTVVERSGGSGLGGLLGVRNEARTERISTVLLVRPRIADRAEARGASSAAAREFRP